MIANTEPSGLVSRVGRRYEVALDVIGAVIANRNPAHSEPIGIEKCSGERTEKLKIWPN
jgi:hypothetical protein